MTALSTRPFTSCPWLTWPPASLFIGDKCDQWQDAICTYGSRGPSYTLRRSERRERACAVGIRFEKSAKPAMCRPSIAMTVGYLPKETSPLGVNYWHLKLSLFIVESSNKGVRKAANALSVSTFPLLPEQATILGNR